MLHHSVLQFNNNNNGNNNNEHTVHSMQQLLYYCAQQRPSTLSMHCALRYSAEQFCTCTGIHATNVLKQYSTVLHLTVQYGTVLHRFSNTQQYSLERRVRQQKDRQASPLQSCFCGKGDALCMKARSQRRQGPRQGPSSASRCSEMPTDNEQGAVQL